MDTTHAPAPAIPEIPEAVLVNIKRTQRIIDAFEQMMAERAMDVEEGESVREPSCDDIRKRIGGSLRDIAPVLKVHKQLTPMQTQYDALPEGLTLQVLSSLNQHFSTTRQSHDATIEQFKGEFALGIAELTTELGTLEKQADELTHQGLEKDSHIEQLSEDKAELREEVAQWQGKHQGVTDQYQQAATELRETKEALARSLTAIDTLKAEHQAALVAAETSHQAQRVELIQQHEKASDVLMTELGNERGERKGERKGFEKQQAELRAELVNAQQAHADRNVLLTQSHSEVRQLTQELTTLQRLHGVSQGELKDLQPLPEALRQQLVENDRLSGENAQLQQQMAQQVVTPEQLKTQLDAVTSAMSEIQQQLKKS